MAVSDGKIPSTAHALGQHKYEISFVPQDAEDHYITVRFNNEPVPGSPFVCRLSSAPQRLSASGAGLERAAIGEEAIFSVSLPDGSPVKQLDSRKQFVEIRDPTGKTLPVEVKRDSVDSKKFSVIYTPKVVGNHTVIII